MQTVTPVSCTQTNSFHNPTIRTEFQTQPQSLFHSSKTFTQPSCSNLDQVLLICPDREQDPSRAKAARDLDDARASRACKQFCQNQLTFPGEKDAEFFSMSNKKLKLGSTIDTSCNQSDCCCKSKPDKMDIDSILQATEDSKSSVLELSGTLIGQSASQNSASLCPQLNHGGFAPLDGLQHHVDKDMKTTDQNHRKHKHHGQQQTQQQDQRQQQTLDRTTGTMTRTTDSPQFDNLDTARGLGSGVSGHLRGLGAANTHDIRITPKIGRIIMGSSIADGQIFSTNTPTTMQPTIPSFLTFAREANTLLGKRAHPVELEAVETPVQNCECKQGLEEKICRKRTQSLVHEQTLIREREQELEAREQELLFRDIELKKAESACIAQVRRGRKGSEDLSTRSRSSHRSKSSKSLITITLAQDTSRLLLNSNLNQTRNRVRVSVVPLVGRKNEESEIFQNLSNDIESCTGNCASPSQPNPRLPRDQPHPLFSDPDRLHRLHRLRLQGPSSNIMEETETRRISWRGLDRRPSWRMSDEMRMFQTSQTNIQPEDLPNHTGPNFILPLSATPRSSSSCLPQVAQASTEMKEQKPVVSVKQAVTYVQEDSSQNMAIESCSKDYQKAEFDKICTQYAASKGGRYCPKKVRYFDQYTFKCALGHTLTLNKQNLESEKWCEKCQKTLQVIKQTAAKNKGVLLQNYLSTEVKSRCQFGHEFTVSCSSPKNWCQTCCDQKERFSQFSKNVKFQPKDQVLLEAIRGRILEVQDSGMMNACTCQKQGACKVCSRISGTTKLPEVDSLERELQKPELETVNKEIKKLSNLYTTKWLTEVEKTDCTVEQVLWVYRILLYPNLVLKHLLFQEGEVQAKQNFRKLAILIHPDKNSHQCASQAFKKLLSVFEAQV